MPAATDSQTQQPTRRSTQTYSIQPQWLYLTLTPLPSQRPSAQLDAPTVRLHLLSALNQYLGDHGAAIPVDILHIHNQIITIRVPRAEGEAFAAGVSAGGELRIVNRSEWLDGLVGSGQDLFD